MKTILITGFDPFGGEPINPAWEAVKTMDGYTDGDYKVVTQMVPTIRYKSVDTVKAAAEQCQPDFILCVSSHCPPPLVNSVTGTRRPSFSRSKPSTIL